MSFLKNLQKSIKAHHFIALIGILVLGLAIMQYSAGKQFTAMALVKGIPPV